MRGFPHLLEEVIVKAKEEEKVLSSADNNIYVHVYAVQLIALAFIRFPRGSRLFAGYKGLRVVFSSNADTGALNLARKVEDGGEEFRSTCEPPRASGSSVGVPRFE